MPGGNTIYADIAAGGEPMEGVIARDKEGNITRFKAATTPTNSVAGYAKGCEWINTAGSTSTTAYRNVGTATSTTWLSTT